MNSRTLSHHDKTVLNIQIFVLVIGVCRNRTREHIRGQRDTDCHIRLHSEKRDKHRTDDCRRTHSGKTGAKSGTHTGEKRHGENRKPLILLHLLEQCIHIAVDDRRWQRKRPSASLIHSLAADAGKSLSCTVLPCSMTGCASGVQISSIFRRSPFSATPEQIPFPHQTIYIDRNKIRLDMADFNDLTRRFAAWVIRQKHQNIKCCLRQLELLTQRPARRTVCKHALMHKFQSSIHAAPPEFHFGLFKFEVIIARTNFDVKKIKKRS